MRERSDRNRPGRDEGRDSAAVSLLRRAASLGLKVFCAPWPTTDYWSRCLWAV